MNNYIDIPNENELYDVDEYQQKKMAEYKKPEKIKNLEQLKRILQKNGESKKDFFLHIINYGQNLSQFENNIKNIYNQVNQVEFFQNLKKQLKRNIRQVINSQEYFLNGDLKQVKKVKNNLGENSKIFRNQPSLSKTFSYQEDSLGLESGNKLNNYESNTNMILSRQNSIQQPDQMLNLHQKQLNFNQNQNEISKQQSLSVNINLFDEEDDAHGEEQKQQNLIQNQQQQNQRMELEFQKPNKVRNNGMLSKKLKIDQVNFDENQELNQFFQQPKIQEQQKKLDFLDEDQNQLQEEQIQMVEFQDQEWDGVNNLRKNQKILNKEMEYKKNGHLFRVSSNQDGKNQVEKKREMILNQFNYYNQDVFNQSWLLPKRSLNRVEIDLNDKQFFLEKVNGILSVETKIFKEIEKKKQKEIEQQKKEQENLKPANQMDKISAHELQSSVHGGAMSIAKGSDNQIKKDSEQIIKPVQGLVSVDHLIEQNKQNFKESDIQHSLVALSFKYNEFKQEPKSYKKYHRFCIIQHLLSKSNERFLGITRPVFMKLEHQSKVKNQDLSFDQGVENMESFQKFDTSQKLSCMGGQFALFEYAEQNPLIMQNIGMGSKIYKYVYDQRLKEQVRLNENMNQLNQFRDYINKKLGSLGSVKFLNNGEKCGDLIGNLLDRDIIGLTVLKNNLFQAPIFIKKAPVTDFLLVKRKEKDPVTQQEIEKYYLRKINHIYIVGQIEPMTEVFNPSQRLYTQFNKKLLNTVVQVQIAQNGSVTLQDLQNIFIKEDEGPLKKALQDNAQPAYVDNSYIIEDPAKRKDPKQYEVKPEQACSYEKMLNSKFLLENFGIKKMVKCEKIKIAINQYIENRPEDLEGYVIAKLIWDQLNLAGWNLTSKI
ncbi:hypothetical protein PPERSA_08980 [Pseudocohnilembus persalinus]|uniref:Transcription initiation factor TFIID subunit 1 histone acetyltransferase domain-containing protein n=1 Tax=Pseudocohnilembus persalinus TaxID=266149 RepID=A0A0V0R2X3_PSEPJ|nr:hypothetical protein PPERSA_08980 [Pseudocohnilembus persalinus]|eukprot:KRX08876.1 hypothetical protein PPERSA_08980 [Pseudocohnilembus persalinus]